MTYHPHGFQPSLPPGVKPKHTVRNVIILGGFVAWAIMFSLNTAGLLGQVGAITLFLGTAMAYGALVAVGLLVRYLVTGKNVHQP